MSWSTRCEPTKPAPPVTCKSQGTTHDTQVHIYIQWNLSTRTPIKVSEESDPKCYMCVSCVWEEGGELTSYPGHSQIFAFHFSCAWLKSCKRRRIDVKYSSHTSILFLSDSASLLTLGKVFLCWADSGSRLSIAFLKTALNKNKSKSIYRFPKRNTHSLFFQEPNSSFKFVCLLY